MKIIRLIVAEKSKTKIYEGAKNEPRPAHANRRICLSD